MSETANAILFEVLFDAYCADALEAGCKRNSTYTREAFHRHMRWLIKTGRI